MKNESTAYLCVTIDTTAETAPPVVIGAHIYSAPVSSLAQLGGYPVAEITSDTGASFSKAKAALETRVRDEPMYAWLRGLLE